MKPLIALIGLGLVLTGCGNAAEEIAAHFDDYYGSTEGISRTQTSFEGGTQYVWLTDNGASVGVIARDGEDTVEVTITDISGS